MKKMYIVIVGFLLAGCVTHYPYAGSLASAEQEIATAKPEENVFLHVQARGKTWVRYAVIYGFATQVTNGTAILRIEHGEASVSGPARAQATIKRILDLK